MEFQERRTRIQNKQNSTNLVIGNNYNDGHSGSLKRYRGIYQRQTLGKK